MSYYLYSKLALKEKKKKKKTKNKNKMFLFNQAIQHGIFHEI